jgi:uncharacterized protein (TIGR00369 family)
MNEPYRPLEADQEARIIASIQNQEVMKLLKVRILKIGLGEVHLEFPYDHSITQQNGYIHAGILTTVVDSACGCAAFSMMPPNSGVLSIEFKINFLSPAVGEKFIAIGKVIKAGRNITACTGEVFGVSGGAEKLVAIMQATMMTVAKQND